METYKTLDGVAVDNKTIMMVAIILSDCSTKSMEALEMQSFFFDLAITFIGAITNEQLEKLFAHHATIKVMRLIMA